ncbi:hypothetical protein HBH64_164170 [Parastagonospora nodorum]|nr:hypothetical protein HBH52_138750 [Parastagonospora nodorum]KAH4294271.1 hypothetical protein HBI01_164810 [Parastagonospora nodorum]KAH4297224.1 hypothetical protein HBI02_164790 [Parastagonospora nodorum]KAH4325603.1 hypothetical protein HBI00_151500 [Parastagonospora nodorum]KAH4363179.1 hypothetical protein HBH94_170890 [Parastagonospora nodorum]
MLGLCTPSVLCSHVSWWRATSLIRSLKLPLSKPPMLHPRRQVRDMRSSYGQKLRFGPKRLRQGSFKRVENGYSILTSRGHSKRNPPRSVHAAPLPRQM